MLLLLLVSLGLGQRVTRGQIMGCINPAMKAMAKPSPWKPNAFCKGLFMYLTDKALKTVAGQIFMAKTPAVAKKLLTMQAGSLIASGKAITGISSRRKLRKCAMTAYKGPTKKCSSTAGKVLNFFVTKTNPGQVFAYLEPGKMACVNKAIKGSFPRSCSRTIKRVMKFFLGKTLAGKVLMAKTRGQLEKALRSQRGHIIHYGLAYKGIPKKLQMRCVMDAKIGKYEKICRPMYLEYLNWLMSSSIGMLLLGKF